MLALSLPQSIAQPRSRAWSRVCVCAVFGCRNELVISDRYARIVYLIFDDWRTRARVCARAGEYRKYVCQCTARVILSGMASERDPGSDIRCRECGKTPSEIGEYVEAAEDNGMTPDDYVREEEGTFDPRTGRFYCTKCYIAVGMPVMR